MKKWLAKLSFILPFLALFLFFSDSLIGGIFDLFGYFLYFSPELSFLIFIISILLIILGFVLSLVSLVLIKNGKMAGKGYAIAALIINSVLILFFILLSTYIIFFANYY